MPNPLSYVSGHWRGEQGLGWSFWVNLVALQVLIQFGQSFGKRRMTAQSPLRTSMQTTPTSAANYGHSEH